jgi:sugar phosphate isomerase/epimerase
MLTSKTCTRRRFLRNAALTAAGISAPDFIPATCWAAPARLLGATAPTRTQLGVCIYSYTIRPGAERSRGKGGAFADPLNFLDHCHRLGAGGIQVGLGIRDDTYTTQLRRRAEAYRMFIEGSADLPGDRAGVERFQAQVRTAKRAGAKLIRAVIMPGRRYETFHSAEQFRQAADRGRRSIELAEPIAAREGIRLAIENHKDQRVGERLELLRRISSEYVGVCLDTGNSIALLEDPMEVVRAYAPWAYTSHLKDMAVREYEDGFLLSEVPLGEGMLNLTEMIGLLRRARPEIQFTLEMITRDPLKVPCLTQHYWATMGDVRGSDLARTLRMVRAHGSKGPLPRVSGLAREEQIQREEENIQRCLRFARDRLRL